MYYCLYINNWLTQPGLMDSKTSSKTKLVILHILSLSLIGSNWESPQHGLCTNGLQNIFVNLMIFQRTVLLLLMLTSWFRKLLWFDLWSKECYYQYSVLSAYFICSIIFRWLYFYFLERAGTEKLVVTDLIIRRDHQNWAVLTLALFFFFGLAFTFLIYSSKIKYRQTGLKGKRLKKRTSAASAAMWALYQWNLSQMKKAFDLPTNLHSKGHKLYVVATAMKHTNSFFILSLKLRSSFLFFFFQTIVE